MKMLHTVRQAALGTAMAAVVATGIVPPALAPAIAQPVAVSPANEVTLSVGSGKMVRLDGAMTDLFVANDAIADVQVRSQNQIYIFGKGPGVTTIYATGANGRVVYSANVRVGQNIDSIDGLLQTAMPEAQVQATSMNGLVLLTGTVKAPADAEEAVSLVQAYVGDGTRVVSRLKTATPLQVMLQVKVAEVNRSLFQEIGVNLLSRDTTGGFLFGLARGRSPGTIGAIDTSGFPTLDASALYGLPTGSLELPFNPATGQFIVGGTQFNPANPGGIGTTFNLAGNLLGVDLLSALDLNETDGLVTTLAEPTLTALSGETASFLAGGEFPVPIAQSLGAIAIEYKNYGVSLAFTPTVLEDGRISMRVRPEVSELSNEFSIELNGFEVPALVTRRAETTVELGSGQSFMIGGLLRNAHTNSTDKAPWLGDLPILGALFRSNRFRRAETELVIVVTPYLVKPVNANQIRLPTDGIRTTTSAGRLVIDQQHSGTTYEQRPVPRLESTTTTVAPGVGPISAAPAAPAGAAPNGQAAASAAPGFGFN